MRSRRAIAKPSQCRQEPGIYTFGFESNDGVRLEIEDYMVLEDPGVHSDQFSDLGMIQANAPGWYPITIRYFERKSTSTLRFYWLPPGGEPGTLPPGPGRRASCRFQGGCSAVRLGW
jgi:hypothetical protein